ncbi:hypothetical protein CERSUDRAFT_114458 [Gelatoporia subvermispora B]|uniref:Uncharacterized protein n=1 Tax=Ceriporiopsis subvermispora (strain B) TaxID=914234 RepID=M2RH41_CERS8|nr:hypothetical protein CERSUDRAFT_114458 [Gelatoporia subvermispora B]
MEDKHKHMVNSAHAPGYTCLAFARDGSRVYTGGSDSLVRIFRTDKGSDQEPDVALDAAEGITALATSHEYFFTGSVDSEVRQYNKDYSNGEPQLDGNVTSAHGVAIRDVAVDPKGKRIAVTSDEPDVKLIDIHETTNITLLKGHTKAVRSATWHPSGSLLATCSSDGKVIVWDVSGSEPKQEKILDGLIPAVSNPDSSEFGHDCSAVWHTSGQHFYVATKAHEIVSISRNDWLRSATFSDDACSGAVTALALSKNGVYLASACQSGIFIWSTQTRRMLFRFQNALTAPVLQMAFSPSQNLLAWTDADGVFHRWPEPIPATSPDPVKLAPGSATTTLVGKRKTTPTLFDDPEGEKTAVAVDDVDLDEDVAAELDNDDWILDDLGGGMADDDSEAKRWGAKDGVREMVSVTKAQPPFQPGATPMANKKRYLAYNMIGVIEVTDQDTHHIVNVEFHDKSARKSYHFTDHFKYDLASLGERGAAYACQPENEHPAHVLYKPYGAWAAQGEWQYELPKGTRVLGVSAGGPPPTKSLRDKSEADLLGYGNVVVATSDNELIFLSGTGIERCCLSLQGDYVTMIAGPEWVFVVYRDGATTMDGSQNLTGRLIKFDDFCLLQKDSLPIPKRHTLKWVGITEEGAPAIYDSSGVLNILPRYRLQFAATWTRILNTNDLERREGKQESYWLVGVAGDILMCLILKGRQEYPSFPRPLIQELPIRLPFKRTGTADGSLEEVYARETMLLDIIRDSLGDDELTTDDIAKRELALDKELIKLIQSACKGDRLARALDLTRLIHHAASIDVAIKVAAFYHLVGLQEKMEMIKEEREAADRLEEARDKRRQRAREFAAVPAARIVVAEPRRPKPFQDFQPPPARHRPGLERATPAPDTSKTAGGSRSAASNAYSADTDLESSFGGDYSMNDHSYGSPSDSKRKRPEEDTDVESQSYSVDISTKRRAIDTPVERPRGNPFARKAGQDNGRSPFAKTVDASKSLHKSDSFFAKVDAVETNKTKAAAKGKGKEKKAAGRQTTLFGLPPPSEPEKKAPGRPRKKTPTDAEESQATTEYGGASETQTTDVAMSDVQDDTQESLVQETPEMNESMNDGETETPGSPEPIEWPPSPVAQTRALDVEVGAT